MDQTVQDPIQTVIVSLKYVIGVKFVGISLLVATIFFVLGRTALLIAVYCLVRMVG